MTGILKPLTIDQILNWADLHYMRTGRWPNSRTGVIVDYPERTWESVQTALSKGTCGMPGGSSLYRLLQRRRDAKDPRLIMPDLTIDMVLHWADSHNFRTGRWPGVNDGPVAEAPLITWGTIDRRMFDGDLGLKSGTTLAKWLRSVRNVWDGGKPILTVKLVLRWANEHFAKFGRWPVTMSGYLYNHPGENWAAIDMAIRHKRRGFPIATSLSRLLTEHYGEVYRRNIIKPKDSQPRRQVRQVVRRERG